MNIRLQWSRSRGASSQREKTRTTTILSKRKGKLNENLFHPYERVQKSAYFQFVKEDEDVNVDGWMDIVGLRPRKREVDGEEGGVGRHTDRQTDILSKA